MSKLFVIARDDPADDDLALAAERVGSTLLRLPLLETEPGPDRDRLLAWLRNPPRHTAIAWTSKRAGQALANIALPSARGALLEMPLFAVGDESARPIRDSGFRVEIPDHGEGAGALAARILAQRDELGIVRVAFLRGDKSLPTLRQALQTGGVAVEEFEVYRTRHASPDVLALEQALLSGSAVEVAYFSPSGVEGLERLLSPGAVKALRDSVPVHSIGDITRAALLQLGYKRTSLPLDFCQWLTSEDVSKGLQSSEGPSE